MRPKPVTNGTSKKPTTAVEGNTVGLLAPDETDARQKWTHLAAPAFSELALDDQRRGSVLSQKSTSSDVVGQHTVEVTTPGEDDAGGEDGLTAARTDSYTRSAIPFLPLPAAVTCFLMNTLLPGTGTYRSQALFCSRTYRSQALFCSRTYRSQALFCSRT